MRYAVFLTALALLYSCSPVTRGKLNKTFRSTEEQFQNHTGFVLYDTEKKKIVFDYHGSRYFTPASNTKIFTFYASLKILGDSVPALEYVQRDDSLIFWGTGDPSFLYKEVFYDSTVYKFLSTSETELYFSSANFHTMHFGEGWAWDDYNSGYSAERSPFPVYGNIISLVADQHVIKIAPEYFSPFFRQGEPREETEIERAINENAFTVHPAEQIAAVREINIPIRMDSSTFLAILSDTLKRPVRSL
ncbi:MAG TPA: D-alanyl-D-alanine carboxypeptidase, partial [Chryseosolibacter sp.]|nr:D-alanyl-D-alanine carboxypeptidase [Chryseosolibacter sp.]